MSALLTAPPGDLTTPAGLDTYFHPAGLLADLDQELRFLVGGMPMADSITPSNTTDVCCNSVWSNSSECCPTVATSVSSCCD